VLINFYLLCSSCWATTSGQADTDPGTHLSLGGIQLITIGILAEIAVRTYFESQHKKTYQVRHVYKAQTEYKPVLEITV
jgi:hypothetical protein